jgi:hypothetical protein
MPAAVLMPEGRTVRQTQPLHVCGAGGPVTSQYRGPDGVVDDNAPDAGGGGRSASRSPPPPVGH